MVVKIDTEKKEIIVENKITVKELIKFIEDLNLKDYTIVSKEIIVSEFYKHWVSLSPSTIPPILYC